MSRDGDRDGERRPSEFTRRVIHVIESIPRGKVLNYGSIAALAGDPRGARQVVRVLHAMSAKHGLPWHRVVGIDGTISLNDPTSYEEQKRLLESEGIAFSDGDVIDARYFWRVASPGDIPGSDG